MRMILRFIALSLLPLALPALAQIGGPIAGGGGAATSVSSRAFPLLGTDGTKAAPTYSFSNETNSGWYRRTSGTTGFSDRGAEHVTILDNGTFEGITTTGSLILGAAGSDLSVSAPDLFITRRTNGVVLNRTSGASQLSLTQATAPTCTSNCGTSPSVVGTDTAGTVTMGATGAPASGWVVTFNGTWPAAPSCIVQSALSTMVAGKMPIAVATTATTMTVTTNGTAPANSDKYAYHCFGVS